MSSLFWTFRFLLNKSDLKIMNIWANYTCIILEEDSKESWNVQNKEDINPIIWLLIVHYIIAPFIIADSH